MKRRNRSVNIRFLGRVPKRVAVLLVILVAAVAGMAVVSTGIAVNYSILKARILFLEKVLQPDVVPEEVDILYERALALDQQIYLQPELARILEIVERVEKRLDRPVVTSATQLQNLLGGYVYAVGVVTRVTSKPPHLFINVNDIFVPLFNMEKDFRHIKVGYKIAVAGQVKEYNGTLEVIPSSKDDVMVLEEK